MRKNLEDIRRFGKQVPCLSPALGPFLVFVSLLNDKTSSRTLLKVPIFTPTKIERALLSVKLVRMNRTV